MGKVESSVIPVIFFRCSMGCSIYHVVGVLGRSFYRCLVYLYSDLLNGPEEILAFQNRSQNSTVIFKVIQQVYITNSQFRQIYRLFRVLFDATMGFAGLGYFTFLLSVFVIPSPFLSFFGFTLLFYGLYFGVLSRDIVDYIIERMSVTIGVSFKKHLIFITL